MQRYRHRGVCVTSPGRVLACLALLLGACGTEPADEPDSSGSEPSEAAVDTAPSTAQPESTAAPPTSLVEVSPAADGEATDHRPAEDSADGEGSPEQSDQSDDQASDKSAEGEAENGDESAIIPQVTFPEATVRDAETEAADLERRRSVIGLFERLLTETEHRGGYNRDAVFPGWLYSNGQSTRERVLADERRPDGTWNSAYDSTTVTSASDLDIDHLVPLAEAWESGGYAWSADTWTRFANDLGDARSLIAVSSSTNRSKGSRDPQDWWPPQSSYRCQYAADWIAVKVRWGLRADGAEQRSLDAQLASCTGAEFEFSLPILEDVTIEDPSSGEIGSAETEDEAEPAEADAEADAVDVDCHPAYEPCLPNLPGDALNCGDLTAEQKPVRVKVIGEDPYRFDRDGNGVGCQS